MKCLPLASIPRRLYKKKNCDVLKAMDEQHFGNISQAMPFAMYPDLIGGLTEPFGRFFDLYSGTIHSM
jgi:hypothetical protein